MISKDNNNNDNQFDEFDLVCHIRSVEIELLKSALIRSNGDPDSVASKLGVDPSYVFAKAKQLGLEEFITSNSINKTHHIEN